MHTRDLAEVAHSTENRMKEVGLAIMDVSSPEMVLMQVLYASTKERD